MIQMLRKESCAGSIDDLAHVRTEVCMSDCLTKQSAKPDTLIRAVRTGVIPGVDTNPPFRSTLKHRAFVMNFLVETLGYSPLDAVHCQFFGTGIDSYPDQEMHETGENCVCNSSMSFAATNCQYFDLETDDCQCSDLETDNEISEDPTPLHQPQVFQASGVTDTGPLSLSHCLILTEDGTKHGSNSHKRRW